MGVNAALAQFVNNVPRSNLLHHLEDIRPRDFAGLLEPQAGRDRTVQAGMPDYAKINSTYFAEDSGAALRAPSGKRPRMPPAGPAGSVAVLSDIHGVLPALQAVLAEPEVRAADLIVITGDHASGPQPAQVLDRLAELGDQVLLVRGNADRELVALARGQPIEIPDEITPWAAAQLSPRHISLLAGLPHPVTIEISGLGPTVFCHGTVRDDSEVVLVDTRIEKWAEVLAGLPGDVTTVVCGHTHMPFSRLADGRQVVNPGSVGMPYGRAGAHWALLRGGAITLRRTAYDLERAEREIRAECTFAGIAEWTDYFLHARAGDREVIGVFGPRDGRRSAAGAGAADG